MKIAELQKEFDVEVVELVVIVTCLPINHIPCSASSSTKM